MTAESGNAFLLKIGNGAAPPVYATVAGLRATQLSIAGEMVPVTNKDSGGTRSVSVAGSGVFTGSAAEARLKANALAGLIDDYQLSFESGERIQGRFLLTKLDYSGDFNGERAYTLALESSGAVASL
jgi:predicted secreted protein